MKKKLVIIGGGVSGLTAGIYAQKNGFKSMVIEKHNIPGGELTGWYRDGNYIDGCIHWLMGTKKGTEMRSVWEEIGAIDDDNIIKMDYFTVFKSHLGDITIWRDTKKFKEELLQKAQEDKKAINEFIRYINESKTLEIPAKKRLSERNFFELISFGIPLIPAAVAHGKAGKYSLFEFSKKFKNPLLVNFFNSIFSPDHNLYSFCVALGSFMDGNADIPKGGSLDMAQRIARKYQSLGGKLVLNTNVDKANIKDNKIVSFLATNLKTKEEIEIDDFDYAIFSCDADVAYHKILDNKYNDPIFEARFNDSKRYPILSCCLVSFAVDTDMSKYPHSVMVETKPFMVGKTKQHKISFRNYYYYKNKSGKTTLISMVTQNGESYDYWKKLYDEDNKKYHDEKMKVADLFKAEYLKLFPELEGKIEFLDMTTPLTYEHYLNAFKGGYISFKKTKNTKWKSHHGAIDGLKNALISGQWTQIPGGAPPAATSGKFSIADLKKIVKKDK
ncbi:FAD-dependent oxidoreductase [Acholeplasma sp. OttesenSCG-928-E16]|nr:FAD-dependent oxidoreductase [Acholeplasma sp. OttesenSCG-928-E16]